MNICQDLRAANITTKTTIHFFFMSIVTVMSWCRYVASVENNQELADILLIKNLLPRVNAMTPTER